MFAYSDSNKRYHTYDYTLRHQFGEKVVKIGVNAGCTCPNLDGTKGYGGCTYCANGGDEFLTEASVPLAVQFAQGREKIASKWPQAKYIVYFQSHTNTYAPVTRIRSMLEEALQLPDVVGIHLATRADCLPSDVLDCLEEFSHRTALEVELGLQTIHEETARRIHRCHTYAEFLTGYSALLARSIPVCVHLINGLPGESREQMLESAIEVGKLRPAAIKLHLLHILEGTAMANEYRRGTVTPLSKEEYVALVCDQLERIPPEITIERITGDGDARILLAPLWSKDKRSVLNAIDKELARRNTFQGIFSSFAGNPE